MNQTILALILFDTLTQIYAHTIGEPSYAVVPPGKCQFNEEWTSVPLKGIKRVSRDTKIFTFSTPDPTQPLNLSTCACLLAQGDSIVRPYTPISTNALIGEFELLVKIYPNGKLTQYINKMKIGDRLEFKHIDVNVKKQYPFGSGTICMLVGGTGITPMIQALHAILGNKNDKTKVILLYGSQKASEILCEEQLHHWSKQYPNRLFITHVISNPTKWYRNIGGLFRFVWNVLHKFGLANNSAGSSWGGECGYISKEMIREKFVGDDVTIFVCGPPAMYNVFCGPREEKEVTGILGEMGYSQDQVVKF